MCRWEHYDLQRCMQRMSSDDHVRCRSVVCCLRSGVCGGLLLWGERCTRALCDMSRWIDLWWWSCIGVVRDHLPRGLLVRTELCDDCLWRGDVQCRHWCDCGDDVRLMHRVGGVLLRKCEHGGGWICVPEWLLLHGRRCGQDSVVLCVWCHSKPRFCHSSRLYVCCRGVCPGELCCRKLLFGGLRAAALSHWSVC